MKKFFSAFAALTAVAIVASPASAQVTEESARISLAPFTRP